MSKVLVVDSCKLVREVVCAGLGTIGVEGVEAEPREAMEVFEGGDFDLIITGRSMPTPEKGETLVLLLKAIDPAVPVLMLSSGITYPPIWADALLPKPFSMEVLLETVKILLTKPRVKRTKYSHYGYNVYDEPQPPSEQLCKECSAEHSITECCPA